MSAEAVIADLCRKYAPYLKTPKELDPARVLWALAGCESDFGRAALPRHEPAYCNIAHGRYDIPVLSRKWGCAAHCSYGPWQMMFPHLVDYHQLGFTLTPAFFIVAGDTSGLEFLNMSEHAVQCAVAMLNAEILGRQQATTLAEIAKAWNHGSWRDQFDDSAYTDRAAKFYAFPFPTEPIPPEVTHASGS